METTVNYNGTIDETSVITFSNHTGPATIFIRPELGQTGVVTEYSPGATVDFITFDGAQNITFDGRPGGAGTVNEWTIRNSLNTAASAVFNFINDASNNTLKYLNIEGETVTVPRNKGLVTLGTTTGITGNDNIIISNCKLRDLSVGGSSFMPTFGVFSLGTVGATNSGCKIDSCEFSDIWHINGGGYSYIYLNNNTDTWEITNNHFYQTTDYIGSASLTGSSYNLIQITTGVGYTVSNNFFGGQAPNSGGSPFVISAIGVLTSVIYLGGGTLGGSSTISNNTIANLAFTSSYSSGGLVNFRAIRLAGASDFTVSGNTIGSETIDASLVVNDNSTATSLGFNLIENGATGTVSITSNVISGVRFTGSRTGATINAIANIAASGTVAIEENEIGTRIIRVETESTLNGINTGTTNTDVKRNMIRGLVDIVSLTSVEINGILIGGSSNTVNAFNNVVIIDNVLNSTLASIYGIQDNSSGMLNIYHNSVKIGGSAASGSSRTAALYRIAAGTDNVQNNIFQNERTVNAARHLGIFASVTGGTFNNDYNYIEATRPDRIGRWGAGNQNFTGWQTASSGAANSVEENMTLDADGAAGAGFGGASSGVDLTATVFVDIDGAPRVNPPWIGAYEGPVPLPIELVVFEVHCFSDMVEIEWITATEINNDYFILEKSSNGLLFEEVVKISGAGNSSSYSSYTYKDELSENSYYRLKQVDSNGRYSFSEVISANCNKKQLDEVIIYPNPSKGYITLRWEEKIYQTLAIYDVQGKLVHELDVSNQTKYKNLIQLEQGIYLFQLKGDMTTTSLTSIVN